MVKTIQNQLTEERKANLTGNMLVMLAFRIGPEVAYGRYVKYNHIIVLCIFIGMPKMYNQQIIFLVNTRLT